MFLLALACTAGIYLGLHFSVWILVPTSFLGILGYLATAWALGPLNPVTILVLITACQVSYLLGALLREHYHELVSRLKTRSV